MKLVKTLLIVAVLSNTLFALELVKVKTIVVDGSVYKNGSWTQK